MHDWDATEVPILADLTIGGQPRKVVMFANRNGFYYTLDRTTGKVIVAKPFVDDDVGQGDRRRRPAGAAAGPHAGREGRSDLSRHHRRHQLLAADFRSDRRALFFVNAREVCTTYYRVEAGLHAGRALHRRRGPARARVGESRRTARCAPSIRRPASASGSSSSCRRQRRGC